MHQTIIEILERGMPGEKIELGHWQVSDEVELASTHFYNSAFSDIKSKLPSIAEELEKVMTERLRKMYEQGRFDGKADRFFTNNKQ